MWYARSSRYASFSWHVRSSCLALALGLLMVLQGAPVGAEPEPPAPEGKAKDKNSKKTRTAKKPKKETKPVKEEKTKGPTATKGREVTTASGLEYVDLKVGEGPSPEAGRRVTVHYTGWLKSGKKFDSSLDHGEPFTFVIGVGQVIKGWDEGVFSMKVGGKRKLIIPAKLGYGSGGAGGVIPPNATLIFEVELLKVD